jgi:prepilin-type N-terminal cleavage/methylation domain-containing protein
MRQNKGFTLLEILLVIAAIGILAAIVLVAINPNRQIEIAKNAVRQADINTITKAIQQYSIDNGGVYPVGIETGAKAICRNGTPVGCIDLSILAPTYIASIPEPDSNYYYVIKNNNSNNIEVRYANTVDNIWNIGGVPSLDLNFAKNKSLIDSVSGKNLVTFSRNSIGTYVGADGLIKTAAVNEPRFDHNPVTGESLGLLIEEQRTNFIQESVPSASVDSYWLKRNLTNSQNIVRGPNMLGIDIVPRSSTYSPVYGSYAWAGIETSQTYTNWTSPGVSAIPYRVSFLINPLTWTGNIFLQSQTYDGNPAFGSRITLFSGGNYVANSSFIKAIYSDGTYWIHNIYKPANTGTSFKLGFTVDEQGNDSKKYWVSAIQMESGPQSIPAGTTPDPIFSTSYIPTTGSAVTRQADSASITGTNFSNFFNTSQGTFFADYKSTSPTNARILNFGTGDTSTVISNEGVIGSGANFSSIGNISGAASNGVKVTATTSISESAGAFNGNTAVSTGATSYYAGANSLNFIPPVAAIKQNWIKRVTYWPNRLPNTTLQSITQ